MERLSLYGEGLRLVARVSGWDWLVSLAPALCWSAFGFFVLAWIRWSECKRLMQQVRELTCLGCGYPLKPSWPCPECGVKRSLDDA